MRRVADPQATPVGNLPVRPGLAGFKSERWPASFRNGGRHQIGMPGRNASEFADSTCFFVLRKKVSAHPEDRDVSRP